MEAAFPPSPLALAVLCLLHVAPLHPYAVQRLLQAWGKGRVVNLGQRATLYKLIRRLEEAGLVEILQTERDQQYPERTVYQITPAGEQAINDWLAQMLARPRNEFPQFPAALSFIVEATPQQARALLEERAAALREQLAAVRAHLDGARMPRFVLVDDEYAEAMLTAELSWVEGIAGELAAGTLSWSAGQLRRLAAAHMPD